MPTSHGYFPPRSLGSSNGFATSNSVEPTGNRPLREMSSPNSQHIVQSQSMDMCNHRVTQHHSYTMPHQQELRRLGALAPSFPTNTSVNIQRRLPWCTTQRIPPMVPQMYAIDRRERMESSAPISGSAGVDDYPKLVTNHQAVPEHASSSTAVGYRHQTSKRKAIMPELTLGSSAGVAVESTKNDFFSFPKNYQEHSAKKKKAMAPMLVNEEEEDTADALERMEREIQLFPQHVAHELFGNESEFSVYRSSSYMGGFDATLDLSLNLSSSSSGESGMAMDLSLKLRHNP